MTDRPVARAYRPAFIAALTITAACTDAVSYLGLGHVFPANMTGNTVLLGLGGATGDRTAVAGCASALGAYVLAAVLIGAVLPAEPGKWRLRVVLVTELCLLLAAALWWMLLPGPPSGGVRAGLIAMTGAAMGTQSSMVARLRVPGVATTYITGTWTRLSMSIGGLLLRRSGNRSADRPALQGLVVLLYPLAGFGAAAAYTAWRAPAALLPVGAVALATVTHARTGPMSPPARERRETFAR